MGGGLAFRLNDEWSVTPGVRVRSLDRDLETQSVTLRYVTVGVGFTMKF